MCLTLPGRIEFGRHGSTLIPVFSGPSAALPAGRMSISSSAASHGCLGAEKFALGDDVTVQCCEHGFWVSDGGRSSIESSQHWKW